MAAPNYTTDLQDITLAESTTGWSALGGGASGLGVGSDFAMQGTFCVDKQITNAEKGQVYNFGSTITNSTGLHFFVWVFLATPGLSDTLANRGLGIVIGTNTNAYNTFHVEGNDTYGAAGRVGKCYPIRYTTASNGSIPYRTLTGSPGANPQYFGSTANITSSVKGANLGVDAIRYGTGAYITAGDSGTPATFDGYSLINDNISNRWGIFSKIGGNYELQGIFAIGQNNSGTPTLAYFNDSNRTISIVNTPHTNTDFTQIIIDHASTEVYWTNINIQALGTNNPGQIILNNTSSIVQFNTCTFTSIGITTLQIGATVDGTTWRGCGQIIANSATITNCNIANYSGSSDTSALVWNTAVDPDGYLDGTTFTKGSGTTHAIEFGTLSPTTMTLSDVNFSGYNAANGQNDSALHIKRTSGTVTINIVGGNTPSYKSDGATVVIVSGTVNVTINVKDAITGSNIQNARVFIQAIAGGPFPYNASVSITRSGSTATVTHTLHGLTTNDKIVIKGADQQEYNGVHDITVTGTNSYTFTVTGTPTTPATGTILASFTILYGLTDASGNITMSRVFPSNQPIKGNIRKSTSSPLYKSGSAVGNVNSSTGYTATIQLIPDE